MGWIPLHDSVFTDDWLCELTESQRWGYVCIVLYARNQSPKWSIKKMNLKHFSRVTFVTEVTLSSVFEAAIKAGKITDDSEKWHIVNGKKYDLDIGAAERMRKYRSKKQDDSEMLRDVTNVTLHDMTGHDMTGQKKDSPEGESKKKRQAVSHPPELLASVEFWNQNKARAWPSCLKITNPLPARFEKANKDSPIDLPAIMNRAKQSDFLITQRFVNLLWIYTRSEKTGNINAIDIADGRYDNRRAGIGEQQRAGNLTPSGADW